jgi:flagellar biosynthesis protein FlhF
MQVKKFEAPTLQEALDTIKRELGPEAIILQTKQNRRGFGLMSKASVEVTAAVSDRSTDKKKQVEKRLPEAYTQKMASAPANRQADFYENYLEKKIEKEKVQLSNQANKRISAVRYADIEDDAATIEASRQAQAQQAIDAAFLNQANDEANVLPQFNVPSHLENTIENYQHMKNDGVSALREEVANLKRLVEELRRERKKPEYIDSDSPFAATEALQEAYEILLQSGIERRFSVQLMREVGRDLNVESRADQDSVLDAVATRLLKHVEIKPFFNANANQAQEMVAFVGVSGAGKTATLAKLATHAARSRNEKIGIIRIQLSQDEGSDPIQVFAKALHVPYRLVNDRDELQVAIQDMSQCNRIFIDTPGISSRDQNAIRHLQNILSFNARVRVQMVVSSTTRDLELHEQAKAYAILNPESLMFTRLDEAFSFGAIYSLSNRLRLPVSVFSTGKKVTADWENATAERLTASILNIL